MSQADKIFVDMCKDIIENGVSTEGEKVRPKWEDGEYAYTILDIDGRVSDAAVEHLKQINGVLRIRVIR